MLGARCQHIDRDVAIMLEGGAVSKPPHLLEVDDGDALHVFVCLLGGRPCMRRQTRLWESEFITAQYGG